MKFQKDVYRIALTKVDGVGPVTAKLLINHFGSAEYIFKAKKKELLELDGIGPSVAKAFEEESIFAEAEKELSLIEKHKINLLFYLDEAYPNRLKHIPDSPILLFSQGKNEFNVKRTVGIVGTRSPSSYGIQMVEKLIEDLKAYNVIVVSGLAHGIDAIAHRSSINQQIPTYGIMGGGFEKIYPAANRKLANDMMKEGGVMTEFCYQIKPDREHFPMRNRLIAALSDALIVVESGKVGGSMITADLANQYNKDVFAIPGRNIDSKSVGCNRLIKQHQANLLESAADLSYMMGWDKKSDIQMSLPLIALNTQEQSVVDLLTNPKGVHLDKIHQELNLPISSLSPLLLSLEFRGIIRSLPGKCYTLN